jgi:hypothetical protein
MKIEDRPGVVEENLAYHTTKGIVTSCQLVPELLAGGGLSA